MLNNLKFAYDLVLIATTVEELKIMVVNLFEVGVKLELHPIVSKTRIMRNSAKEMRRDRIRRSSLHTSVRWSDSVIFPDRAEQNNGPRQEQVLVNKKT